MSGERPTLAEALRDVWLVRGGTVAPVREHCDAFADAAERWFLDRLADEALVERCASAMLSDADPLRLIPPSGADVANAQADVRAVLAQVAEAVRDA